MRERDKSRLSQKEWRFCDTLFFIGNLQYNEIDRERDKSCFEADAQIALHWASDFWNAFVKQKRG